MTKYTPVNHLPWPEGSDPPRGWEQIQALAEGADAAIGGNAIAERTTLFTTDTTQGWETFPFTFVTGSSDMAAAPSGVKVAVAGYYTVSVGMRVSAPASNASFAMVMAPGTAGQYGSTPLPNANSSYRVSQTFLVPCKAGDVIMASVDGFSQAVKVANAVMTVRWHAAPLPTAQFDSLYDKDPASI